LESHGKVVLPLKDHPRSATLNGGIPNINCHFGGLTFAYSESWIVSFVRWLAPLTNARCRLRSGRTKLGTVRSALRARDKATPGAARRSDQTFLATDV